MKHDPFPVFDNLSQKQLGQVFGVSSHCIGMWLKQIGLRNSHGEPTQQAITEGLAVKVDVEGMAFVAWDKKRTIDLLRKAGLYLPGEEDEQPKQSSVLVGPFAVKNNGAGGDGWELVGADGIVGVWVRGRANADKIAAILTIAHRCGKLGGANANAV